MDIDASAFPFVRIVRRPISRRTIDAVLVNLYVLMQRWQQPFVLLAKADFIHYPLSESERASVKQWRQQHHVEIQQWIKAHIQLLPTTVVNQTTMSASKLTQASIIETEPSALPFCRKQHAEEFSRLWRYPLYMVETEKEWRDIALALLLAEPSNQCSKT